jgi:hypothetical protein
MTKILATLCGVREIVTPGDEALKIAAVIKFGRPCHIFLRVGWSPFFANFGHFGLSWVEVLNGKPTGTLAEFRLCI